MLKILQLVAPPVECTRSETCGPLVRSAVSWPWPVTHPALTVLGLDRRFCAGRADEYNEQEISNVLLAFGKLEHVDMDVLKVCHFLSLKAWHPYSPAT